METWHYILIGVASVVVLALLLMYFRPTKKKNPTLNALGIVAFADVLSGIVGGQRDSSDGSSSTNERRAREREEKSKERRRKADENTRKRTEARLAKSKARRQNMGN